jgi:hypothetical protein
MTFRLPGALRDEDDTKALRFLKDYYWTRPGTPLGTLHLPVHVVVDQMVTVSPGVGCR